MRDVDQFPEFLRALPEVNVPLAGANGWTIQGANHQVVLLEFTQNVEVPEHAHAEQWELPIAGRAVLHMHGVSREYQQGESFFIPAGVPHAATVHAGYKAILIFNERDRYEPQG